MKCAATPRRQSGTERAGRWRRPSEIIETQVLQFGIENLKPAINRYPGQPFGISGNALVVNDWRHTVQLSRLVELPLPADVRGEQACGRADWAASAVRETGRRARGVRD